MIKKNKIQYKHKYEIQEVDGEFALSVQYGAIQMRVAWDYFFKDNKIFDITDEKLKEFGCEMKRELYKGYPYPLRFISMEGLEEFIDYIDSKILLNQLN